MADLNRAIDIGLKEISKELDIENFNSMRQALNGNNRNKQNWHK